MKHTPLGIEAAALRRLKARAAIEAMDAYNGFGLTQKYREQYAVDRAIDEHELHEANKEYDKAVNP